MDYSIKQTSPVLNGEEELELATAIAAGDPEAREKLIVSNIRLVVSIAKSFTGRGVLLDDLIGFGIMGLIRASEGFSAKYKYKFSTYASYWIKQSIRRGICDTRDTIRIPTHTNDHLVAWSKAQASLQRDGKQPTDAEIAQHLGLTMRQVQLVKTAARVRSITSGYHCSDYDDGGEVVMQLDAIQATAIEPLYDSEELGELSKRLARLRPKQYEVLRLRFGIGCEPRTLEEIGKLFAVSKERIRQIESSALKALRRQFST